MPSLNQLLARLSDMFGTGVAGIPLANRNMFVDGAFDNFTTTAAMAITGTGQSPATMYYGSAGLGGVAQQQIAVQRTFQNVMSATESAPYNALAHNQTTASTGTFAALNLPWIAQKIEGVQRSAGRSVTFSCKIYASANVTIPGIWYSQNYGTGGSPSAANTQGKAVTWNVTNLPRRFSVRVDMAALPAGVTYGTNNNDQFTLGFFLPPGWTGVIYTTEWQAEYSNANSSNDLNGAGGTPTAFEYRGLAAELQRVNRYYRSIGCSGASFNGFNASAAVSYSFGQVSGTPMRATPAGSLTGSWTYTGNVGNAGSVSVIPVTPDMWYMQATSTSANGIFTSGYFGTGSNGAVVLDARL